MLIDTLIKGLEFNNLWRRLYGHYSHAFSFSQTYKAGDENIF